MKILITGAKGFIGKNLIAELKNINEGKVKGYGFDEQLVLLKYDMDTDPDLLDGYCHDADFVFHLAGVNRPKEQSEFMEGNFGFTSTLLDALKRHGNITICTRQNGAGIYLTNGKVYGHPFPTRIRSRRDAQDSGEFQMRR